MLRRNQNGIKNQFAFGSQTEPLLNSQEDFTDCFSDISTSKQPQMAGVKGEKGRTDGIS